MIIHTTEEKLRENGWVEKFPGTRYKVLKKPFYDGEKVFHGLAEVYYYPSKGTLEYATLLRFRDMEAMQIMGEELKELDVGNGG